MRRSFGDYFYIQVATTIADRATEDREYRPFERIRDSYPRYLLTLDPLLQRRDGVRHLNLMEFVASEDDLVGACWVRTADEYGHIDDETPSFAISLFTPDIWEVGPYDAALSAENMILAAWSLGIGNCCIDRSKLTFATRYGMELRKRANIPDDYVPQLHVVFGYPESTARDSRALYPNRVSWI